MTIIHRRIQLTSAEIKVREGFHFQTVDLILNLIIRLLPENATLKKSFSFYG